MADVIECSKVGVCDVGKVVKHIRTQKDMKQTELSKLTGINNEQISRIERGALRPSIAYLKLLAPYLSLPLDELIALSGYMGRIDGDYVYTAVDDERKVYMDTKGQSVDITKAGLKIYKKSAILFTLLNEYVESCSKTDIELLILLLKMIGKEAETGAQADNEIGKAYVSLKAFLKNFLECAVNAKEKTLEK